MPRQYSWRGVCEQDVVILGNPWKITLLALVSLSVYSAPPEKYSFTACKLGNCSSAWAHTILGLFNFNTPGGGLYFFVFGRN